MRYARIENGIVKEIIDFDPKDKFTKEIEEQFEPCDESVQQNDIFENGTYIKPVIVIDERQNIINKLAELDQYIDRPKENIINFLITKGYQPYQKEIDTISQKVELRQRLQELG